MMLSDLSIKKKLMFAFTGIALLIMLTGFIAATYSEKMLVDSIGTNSATLAGGLIELINADIYEKIEQIKRRAVYLSSDNVLIESNRQFSLLEDTEGYIKKRDDEWTSVPKDAVTPFMKQLISNRLSEELRKNMERKELYEKIFGYSIFDEIIITNRYGANAAQTGKTTDYFQADEDWWISAKDNGLYIEDLGYDESTDTYTFDIASRINDANGDFAGVIMAKLNARYAINSIKKFSLDSFRISELQLVTNNIIVTYAGEKFKFIKKTSDEALSKIRNSTENSGFFISDTGKDLLAFSTSRGHNNIKGLQWIMIVKHKTDDIFTPVTKLRSFLFFISSGILFIAVITSVIISGRISGPINKLRDASRKISMGSLDTKVEVKSGDEIGQLASSFNSMAESLQNSLTKLEEEKNRANTYLHIAGVIIIALDSEGKVTLVNRKASEVLGYAENEILKKNWFENFIPESERDTVKNVFKSIIKGDIEPVKYFENPVITKSGEGKIIAWQNTVLRDSSGNITGTLSSGLDITEKEITKQKLEQKFDEIERLNRLMVGRELKMEDLRKEIQRLNLITTTHDNSM